MVRKQPRASLGLASQLEQEDYKLLTWALLLIYSLNLGKPLILASVFLYEMNVVFLLPYRVFNVQFAFFGSIWHP